MLKTPLTIYSFLSRLVLTTNLTTKDFARADVAELVTVVGDVVRRMAVDWTQGSHQTFNITDDYKVVLQAISWASLFFFMTHRSLGLCVCLGSQGIKALSTPKNCGVSIYVYIMKASKNVFFPSVEKNAASSCIAEQCMHIFSAGRLPLPLGCSTNINRLARRISSFPQLSH